MTDEKITIKIERQGLDPSNLVHFADMIILIFVLYAFPPYPIDTVQFIFQAILFVAMFLSAAGLFVRVNGINFFHTWSEKRNVESWEIESKTKKVKKK